MKNKKILVGILSTSAIGVMAPAIASCGAKPGTTTPSVELSSSTPKSVVVSKSTSQINYNFIQKDVTNPSKTSLELTNFTADGALIESPTGLLENHFDSNNNIICNFNLALAKSQYSATKFTFDIKITNADSGLDKTFTDFEIEVSNQTFSISYPTSSVTEGLAWDVQPSQVEYHDSIEIKFHLTKGYEFVKDETELDVLVGNTSIKKMGGVTFDLTSNPYEENGCAIIIPGNYVDNNVTIKLKSQAKTFHVTKGIGSNFYCGDITKITHGTGKVEVEFHPNSYYETLDWDVTMDGESLKDLSRARLITKDSKQYLQIDCAAVVADVYISATAKVKSYSIKLNSSAQHISFTTSQGCCENDFQGQITVEAGYKVQNGQLSATCTDEVTKQESTFSVDVNDQGWFTIPKSKIHGPIVLNGTTEGKTFTVSYSIVSDDHIQYDTEKTQVTYPDNFITTIEPENGYYTFTPLTDTWDATVNGVSLKSKGKASFDTDKKTLTVQGEYITDDLTITATAKPATWTITADATGCSQLSGITSSTKLTYNTEYVADLGISTWAAGMYSYTATATCHDPVKGDITIPSNKLNIDLSARQLTIPAEYVTGPIDIKFTEAGNKYDVEIEGSHFTYDSEKIGTGKASYGSVYTIEIVPDDYYVLYDYAVQVYYKGTSTKIQSSYDRDAKILTIQGNAIQNNLTIKVAPNPMTCTAAVGDKDTGLTLKTDATQGSKATYGTDYVFRYELDSGYEIKHSSISCAVAGADPLTLGNGLTLDAEHNTITVDGSKITGNLTLTGQGQLITYQLINATTGIKSLSGTPTYQQELEIGVTMDDGYALNGADFADNSLKVMIGESTLTYQSDFDVSDDKITIYATRITNNVKITGTVKSHTVTAKAKTGSEAAFASFTKVIAKEGKALTAHATLAEGYANPTVVAKCGDTELTTTVTVDGTDVAVQISAEQVTGPITLEYDAVASTIVFDESAETQLATGDTSDVISASVISGGVQVAEPSITKISAPDDASWNHISKILTVKDTAGPVTLKASYQGCKSVEHTINIIKPTVQITGSSSVVATNTVNLGYKFTGITPKSSVNSTVWHSSDETVATVDTWGVVTGLSPGTTKITVDVQYGNLKNAITSKEFTLTVTTNKTITFNTDALTSNNIVVDGMSEGVKLASPSLTFKAKLSDSENTPKTGYFTFTNTTLGISVNSGYTGIANGYIAGNEITVDFTDAFTKLKDVDSAELTVTWTEITGAQVGSVSDTKCWDTSLLSLPAAGWTSFIFDADGYRTIKNIKITTKWEAGTEKTVYIGVATNTYSYDLVVWQEYTWSGQEEHTISIEIQDMSKLGGKKSCYLACKATRPS